MVGSEDNGGSAATPNFLDSGDSSGYGMSGVYYPGDADDVAVLPRKTRKINANDDNEYFRACSILNLAVKMREGLSDVTKDRRWRSYRVYKKCFMHKDAISWLMENELEQEDNVEEQKEEVEGKENLSEDDDGEHEDSDSEEREDKQNSTVCEIGKRIC